MSFARLVYYSAIIGGWSAFLAWLLGEILLQGGSSGGWQLAGVGALVGAAIGSGLNLVAGSTNLHWKLIMARLGPGIIAGGIGGIIGIVLGNVLYGWLGLPRAIGWFVMGLGIGAVEGITDRSQQKLRNGLIGGGVGGMIGGFLFDHLNSLVQSGSGMTGRAIAFVILGICIGMLIGLAQVILKQAWLTVLDGYRPGRQLILSKEVTILGRGDHLLLPFMGPNNINLEQEHLRITRQANGAYQVEDNRSKQGTFVNNKPLTAAFSLAYGDVIKLGGNFVRFNLARASGSSGRAPSLQSAGSPTSTTTATSSGGGRPIVPPAPPPPPRSSAVRDAKPAMNEQASNAPSMPSSPARSPVPPPPSPNRIPSSPAPNPQAGSPSAPGRRIPPPPPPPPRKTN
jgi:hypothetical protein